MLNTIFGHSRLGWLLVPLLVGACGGADRRVPEDADGGAEIPQPDVAVDDTGTPDAHNPPPDVASPGSDSEAETGDTAPESPDAGPPEPELPHIQPGFVELEPRSVQFTLRELIDHDPARTSRARLFYSFVPGGPDPRTAPVFVFFNGGPGASTMSGLKMYGTGPWTLSGDVPSERVVANEHTWTKLGNLLYIDARNAGFSYTFADGTRGGTDFNPKVDAGDMVLVLLRVLDSQPSIRNNPVVIVGESYGGIRASLMLSYILKASTLLDPTSGYQDPLLADAISTHFRKVFGGEEPIEGALAARQFGWQVLIQPALSHAYSRMLSHRCEPQIALSAHLESLGLPCPPPSDRCSHHIDKTTTWCDDIGRYATEVLLEPDTFTQLMGTAPTDVPFLPAAQRTGILQPRLNWADEPTSPSEKWVSLLGEVPRDHPYFVPVSDDFSNAIILDARVKFLDNAMLVRTLITHAVSDTVIVSDTIPIELQEVDDVQATIDRSDQTVARPGWIRLTHPRSSWPPIQHADIRFPIYQHAGHMVTVTHGKELLEDVTAFMATSK